MCVTLEEFVWLIIIFRQTTNFYLCFNQFGHFSDRFNKNYISIKGKAIWSKQRAWYIRLLKVY
jgi:hypothetical protein